MKIGRVAGTVVTTICSPAYEQKRLLFCDLLGEDPTELAKLNRRMDACLKGHPYAKSAIDIACWDILGQVCGQPIATLLGGRYGDEFNLYHHDPDGIASRLEVMRRAAAEAGRAQNRRVEMRIIEQ